MYDIKKHYRFLLLHWRHNIQMEFKKAIYNHIINLWSWICSCYNMCLSFHWLRRLLKKLWMPQDKPTKIYVDNSSIIFLVKNPIFHDRSKNIDIIFHYPRDYITNKKVEVKYVKTQDQVIDIFIMSFKYNVFAKIRDILIVIKKSSLKRNIKSKPDFSRSVHKQSIR
jgi:hypothetical protein